MNVILSSVNPISLLSEILIKAHTKSGTIDELQCRIRLLKYDPN